MSRRQTGTRYVEAQRVEALDLAAQVGFAEAGRRLSIPDGTIRSWAARAAAAVPDAQRMTDAVDLASLPWPERRAALLPKLGQVAAEALDAARQAIRAGNGRAAQSFAVVAGIAVDKAQLLGGGATTRSESTSVRLDLTSPADVAQRVATLREQLGYDDGDVVDAEVVGE